MSLNSQKYLNAHFPTEDDEEENSKRGLEEDEDGDGENEETPEEPVQKVASRSGSHSPRSSTRIPTPVSSTRIGDKSPTRRSPSPRPPLSNSTVTQMTQQLNSLMGVGFVNNLTGSRSGSVHHDPLQNQHSPSFQGMNVVRH